MRSRTGRRGDVAAEKILDAMVIFDNIMDIDDRGIQLLLREVQSESLIIAMKGASEELREKIFKNMSQRAADMMRDIGEENAAYAAGWTISGIATLATIVAVWVFAI